MGFALPVAAGIFAPGLQPQTLAHRAPDRSDSNLSGGQPTDPTKSLGIFGKVDSTASLEKTSPSSSGLSPSMSNLSVDAHRMDVNSPMQPRALLSTLV